MAAQKFHEKVRNSVRVLQRYADRFWYPPFIGLLAALDNFIVIIPNDGILISSAMLTPKRWAYLALCIAIGSTVGASALSIVVKLHGLPWVIEFFPGINETQAWKWSTDFFASYGMLLVFIVAATPFVQQPAVILATLAETPILELAAVIFVGRFIKFLVMAYVGSHAPKLLNKMWGLGSELEDAGVKVPPAKPE